MDQYLPISILSTRSEANDACAVLEEFGIPIMLQYVEVEEAQEKLCAYRLLVPLEFTQASLTLLGKRTESPAAELSAAQAA